MSELTQVPRAPSVRQAPIPPEIIGPGSLLWDLTGDHRSNLTFLMPTLMQAMHPVIGDALSRHPVVITDPWGRRTRSVDSIQLWIYGGPEALAESRRLRELHAPVRGRDIDGRDYSALNPEAWAWVPLSAYPAFLTMCRLFGEPLGPAGEERLYEEIKNLARIFGVREQHIPATVPEFWAYHDTMISTRLVNHPFVHDVLRKVRTPPPPPVMRGPLAPLWRALIPVTGRVNVWIVTGTFPPEVRDILELNWTDRDERLLRLTGQAIRYLARVTPEPLRYPPMPRHARRLARAQAAGHPRRAALHQHRLTRHITTIRTRQTPSIV
ncbi:MAG TPA: oxygenase MpaB family protein [Streptosporangiaceae bacterium]|jgi:uncharacterized protein (DUF2236 family)